MTRCNEDPLDIISRMVEERASLSDEALLVELREMEALPPDLGATWQSDSTWVRGYILVAMSDLVARRKIKDGVPLILERMCLGDPGELMRGLRHALEDAVSHDWDFLVRSCESACGSRNPGARYWAADELAVLREPRSVESLARLLDDPVTDVAEHACFALKLIARDHPDERTRILRVLRSTVANRVDIRRVAEKELADVESF